MTRPNLNNTLEVAAHDDSLDQNTIQPTSCVWLVLPRDALIDVVTERWPERIDILYCGSFIFGTCECVCFATENEQNRSTRLSRNKDRNGNKKKNENERKDDYKGVGKESKRGRRRDD